ncbi:response regulator [Colwellia sp. MB02u-9]|uniref:response regulator n=1 Tax=Colwellia sp. MB02u-9 TaxID=2759823 RepID=UPI0015F63ACA|nr:response regulator [Colwellia sp. MB02u-9]MBA6294733.1 response regulator [Colwellia sp. MB02u-9]
MFTSSAVHSQNQSQYIGKNFGQQLSIIEAMADKKQALVLITSLSTDKTLSTLDKISVLASQSRILHQLGQLDHAIDVAQKEQQLAQEFDLKQLEADAYKRVGVYAYYKGKYALALHSYQQALNYYFILDEPIAQANLYNNIALVHAKTSEFESALLSYQLAEKIYQKFGNETDKIDVKFNIADFHLELKRYDIAISMYLDVIESRIKISDKKGIVMAYSDIGKAYKYAGDYEKAEYYMTLSLNSSRKNKYDFYTATVLYHLAELHNDLYNIDQAIAYATEALRLSIEQEHDTAYVAALYSLAKAYFYQGKYDLALQYTERSSEMAEKRDHKDQMQYNLSLQSLIYAAQHENFKAVKSQRDFLQVKFELDNNELNSKLALFNSDQLKQEVEQLKQQKRLQALEVEQSSQTRIIIIIVVIAILMIGFLIARRLIEQRSKQALESKVKQRTTELEYLMQELQSANNIKSQFLANMSHEIRTPLTTVIGQAEAIMSGDVEEEFIGKEVKIIHGNSLHLLELTNNILDLSKIEANKIELEIQTQNLHDILQELANMFSLQASSKGLTFKIIHYLPEPFLIKMDSFRVKQILINLCANAVKFTPKGHVELNISQSENNLMFKITDSGIGMSSSQLQSIFESFTQGDSSISRRFGGTGLGLCLSDQLAKIMGGKIEVESELNQGSVFAFSLPCTASFSEQCRESSISSTKVTVEEAAPLQGTILLAEDHKDNRRLIARLLASLGLEVLTARNGLEAVALFEQHQPTLILMDIQMPEMDGIEAFNILRQKGCKTPIIALTANAMSHEITHYLSLGFSGHLSKPIERNVFIPTITKFYDGSFSYEKASEIFSNLDMSDLVQKFKSNLVLEQQDLVLHINNNDLEQLGRLSHRIAGAAQMFGFAELSKCALQLEMTIKSNQKNQSLVINHHTQQLLNEIDQVLW